LKFKKSMSHENGQEFEEKDGKLLGSGPGLKLKLRVLSDNF